MGKKYTKDETIALKKKSFKSLNALLESFISKPAPVTDEDTDYMKKAALISKWIYQYVNYISFEKKFNPKRNINYKRGDIVFVNFGFGVGTEFGGSHYAVVLDKHSKHSASNITVIPLSSLKNNKQIYERDVYLGNELYEKMQLKLKTNVVNLKKELENIELMLNLIDSKNATSTGEKNDIDEIEQLQESLKHKVKVLKSEINDAERLRDELINLKEGSIAKIEQIRTVSKIRIYNPKDEKDPLYGIRFSEPTMKIINDKIKELFVFGE